MRASASWSKRASRVAIASTSSSSRSSAIARLTYPYCSARGPSKSSATSRISSARPRPTRRASRAVGAPPGTTPMPTSNWPSTAFSRDAKRRSVASTNSLPAPRARPRIEAMLTTGARDRRTMRSVHVGSPVGPDAERRGLGEVVLHVVVGEEEVGVGAVEDDDLELRLLLDQVHELGELADGRRGDRVDRRVVEGHAPVARCCGGRGEGGSRSSGISVAVVGSEAPDWPLAAPVAPGGLPGSPPWGTPGGSLGSAAMSTHDPGLRLLGRRSECAALDALLTSLRRGSSGALVLRGEAGIGKSALLAYLERRASGCGIARAAGVESEMELAFAGLHQLCAPFADRLDRLPGPAA